MDVDVDVDVDADVGVDVGVDVVAERIGEEKSLLIKMMKLILAIKKPDKKAFC